MPSLFPTKKEIQSFFLLFPLISSLITFSSKNDQILIIKITTHIYTTPINTTALTCTLQHTGSLTRRTNSDPWQTRPRPTCIPTEKKWCKQ